MDTMSTLFTGVILSSMLLGFQCLQFNVLNSGNVYYLSSPENTGDNGETLGIVTCTEDGGTSPTGPVTYVILQPVSVPFVLNGNTGVLSLKTGEILDYEQNQQYIFDISCFYDSDSSISARASVTFLVGPVNEFIPVFSDVSLQVTISELTPIGMVIVARDSSGTRQYTVSDGDSGPDGELRFLPSSANPPELDQDFSLSRNGSLTLAQTIDLDTGIIPVRRVTYQIRACDGDRVKADCPSISIALFIRSDNDNPPMFEQEEYTVTVSEATPIGTSLITVVCTDADRNGVGEFSGFTVEQPNAPVHILNNGSIFLKDSLDFENSSSVTVSLVCLDSGGLQDIATLVITVRPENDGVPSFSTTLFECTVCQLAIVSEEICEVQAIDTDNDIITYTLSGLGSENFQIRPDGVLVLVLAAEESFFDLTVTASDGLFNSSINVRLAVNDCTPETISVTASDGLFNASTTMRLAVDCLLSIPEIIIVAVCGVVLILMVIIVTVICSIGCYHQWLIKHHKFEDRLSARSDNMASRDQEQLNSVPQRETVFSADNNGHIHLYIHSGTCFMILFISYTDTIKEVSIEIKNIHYVSAQSGQSTERKYVETGDDQGYTTVMSKKQNKHSKNSDGDGLSIEDENIKYASVSDSQSLSTNNITCEEENSTANAVDNASANCTAPIVDFSNHDYATVLPKHLRNYQSFATEETIDTETNLENVTAIC
ncbi:protocadherin Fat 2-like isoform X3 [Halichondria panicea]|uniref:protocadherin Fat 2-like isoform X3 n=1 Tax=Halichondria panicea TaxID=6063 RepID=UPI00312BC21C